MKKDWKAFQDLIDDQHEWPGHYTFKFVLKIESLGHVKTLLETFEIQEKASSGGKYVSLTITHYAQNSSEVIEVYQKLETVQGLISL